MEGLYYAGWDGGGTATTIECIDEVGKTLLRAKTGPLNVHGNGAEQVRQSILEALRHMSQLPGGLSAFRSLCVAGAGISGDETRAVWQNALEEGTYKGQYQLAADFEAALYGAFDGAPGMILISGTGSVCYGMNGTGGFHRCGGWGHRFDDEGSGYSIGRDVLKAVARAHDGRTNPTLLTKLLHDHWNIKDMPGLMSKAYGQDTSKKEIAALSVLCVEAFKQGDEAAAEIFETAAQSLHELLKATKTVLSLSEVALLGGLLNQETPLRNALEKRLKGDLIVREPKADAARGAALMATKI